MALKRTHKRKKYSRAHGRGMGTAGTGARKNHRKSGNHGGGGMSGSGKRADHKKTLVLKEYGHGYFGQQGITSAGTKRDKRDRINVGEIQDKYSAGEIDLSKYKILGNGELTKKLEVTAHKFSKSAEQKIVGCGGKAKLIT